MIDATERRERRLRIVACQESGDSREDSKGYAFLRVSIRQTSDRRQVVSYRQRLKRDCRWKNSLQAPQYAILTL
jgi:hypothetical protein